MNWKFLSLYCSGDRGEEQERTEWQIRPSFQLVETNLLYMAQGLTISPLTHLLAYHSQPTEMLKGCSMCYVVASDWGYQHKINELHNLFLPNTCYDLTGQFHDHFDLRFFVKLSH
jgi:hypothetical protein